MTEAQTDRRTPDRTPDQHLLREALLHLASGLLELSLWLDQSNYASSPQAEILSSVSGHAHDLGADLRALAVCVLGAAEGKEEESGGTAASPRA